MYWKHLLAVALLATAGAWLYRAGGNAERVEKVQAQAALKASQGALAQSEKARKQEADKARAANAVAEQYEQDKQNAEANADRLAAELRAGRIQLQKRWACPVPEASGSAGQPDAEADDRAESASRIVRAADEADAQITALQNFIRGALK
jgi:hypothetical protein